MNVIELVTKYLPVLDAQYRLESKSAILDLAPEFVQQTKDAKKVKIAKISVDGMGSYSRADGFAKGSVDLTWEEHTFEIDRGRALQVDEMDNEESFGLAFGRLAGTFQKDKVIPEIDAYRFAKYYQKAGTQKKINLAAGEILSVIDELDVQFDDDEVDETGRYLFVNPSVYKMIMNDPALNKYVIVNDEMSKAVNRTIYNYNNHPIIKVPSSRFYTAIDLLDGRTSGQKEGGYKPAADASVIGILMISSGSVIQITKRHISRIWAPTRAQSAGTDGVNPDADAWRFDFRIYHDAWVLDNKAVGIAGVVIESSKVTAIVLSSDTEGVTITSGAAAVTMSTTPSVKLNAAVTATADASKDVTYSTSSKLIATVDEMGVVTFKKAGSVTITATSVYTPSVTGTVTFTVA